MGNGSNELIQATLSVALEPGDVVVAPTPTFSLYRLLTTVLGGRYRPVPLGPDFAFDVDELIDVAVRERARVVVLNSPNNPTGSALPAGAVERVLEETGALVVCDEAYQEFGGPTALPLLARSSRLVVLRTFSKALGMAGLRFGLALAHPAVAREIAKGKLPYNVNVVTLTAAAAALRHQAGARGARARGRSRTASGWPPGSPRCRASRCIRAPPTSCSSDSTRCRRGRCFGGCSTNTASWCGTCPSAAGLEQCLRISVGTRGGHGRGGGRAGGEILGAAAVSFVNSSG